MTTDRGSPPPDAKTRFSTRVEDYIRYRPRYPETLYAFLRTDLSVGQGTRVADVGSGTGIFCEPLLGAGCTVFGVEPNAEMRAAAERLLGSRFPNFHSIDGSAEATTLQDRSVNVVACAQAFHWFDPAGAKAEFTRIARPGGFVLLVWNQRDMTDSPFLADYERQLQTWGTDYTRVAREHQPLTEKDFTSLFSFPFRKVVFANAQTFDFPGLRGRVLSASYTPAPGQPGHAELLAGLRDLFDRHQAGGEVTMAYRTELYVGRRP